MSITKNNKPLRIAAITVIALSLQACLNAVVRPVSESAKDTTGSFDGNWLATGKSTASVQQGIGNWRLNCSSQVGRKFGPMSVKDGVASMVIRGKKGETFVSSSGKFRMEIPLTSTARASDRSDSPLSSADRTFVLSGSLADKNGFLTFALAGLGNTGCTSKMTYDKL